MGRQVFTAGEILTAASMNDLGDQTVMVFDDATARATAIPTPVEGMLTYLEDVGGAQGLEVFDGSVFTPVAIEPDPPAILQVVSSTLTASFSTTSTSFTDVTDLVVSITPSSTDSKIFIVAAVHAGGNPNKDHFLRFNLVRDSTNLSQPSFGGNPSSFGTRAPDFNAVFNAAFNFLDSPSSVSSLTYRVQTAALSGDTVLVNRRGSSTTPAYTSSITVMEVAG